MTLMVSLVATTSLVAWFSVRQNRETGALGGKISAPKRVWLLFAVFVWFVLTPLVALCDQTPPFARTLLGVFAASMWVRGIVELYMLFISKNWKPPLGVAHDLMMLLLLGGGLIGGWASLTATPSLFGRWVAGFCVMLTFSLGLETVYAVLFHSAVQGRTTGDDGVWFAAAGEARFRTINRVTALFNLPLCAFLAAFLLVCFGLRLPPPL